MILNDVMIVYFVICYCFFRKNLNLCSDLLDTPDFYWDRDDLEKLYLELCKLLQTKYRTTVRSWFIIAILSSPDWSPSVIHRA